MYIKSLTLSKLRTFRKEKFHFLSPEISSKRNKIANTPLQNINLILGNNGAGKSTLLKAIALAALSPIIESSGFVPYSLVRHPAGEKRNLIVRRGEAVIKGSFELHRQELQNKKSENECLDKETKVLIRRTGDLERIKNEFPDDFMWDQMFDNKSPAFLVLGYGATRRIEKPENYDSASRQRKVLRFQRVGGLFEEGYSLVPLASWLPQLKSKNPGRYVQVINLINRLLEKPFSFSGDFDSGEYLFKHAKTLVPFEAMSDGYRAYIGWMTDLLYHVCMGCPKGEKLVENRGIVMVDEIDLHLHPSWQRTVISTLSKALPNLQFIFTTHSPIVTGCLRLENIVVLKTKGNSTKPLKISQSAYGLNADQVLVSDYFGLESTRAPGMQQKMRRLNMKALSGDANASLLLLKHLAKGDV